MNGTDANDVLIAFVRGEIGIAVLEEEGLRLVTEPRLEVSFPVEFPAASATLTDIAVGFNADRDDVFDLRIWAFIVLGSNVEIRELEDSEAGTLILDALWAASAGEAPSPESASAIRALTLGPT